MKVKKWIIIIVIICVNYFRNGLYIAFPTLFYHDPDPLQGGKKGNAGECYLSLWLGKNNFFQCIKQYLFSPSLMSEKQFYMAPGYFETEKSLTLFFGHGIKNRVIQMLRVVTMPLLTINHGKHNNNMIFTVKKYIKAFYFFIFPSWILNIFR